MVQSKSDSNFLPHRSGELPNKIVVVDGLIAGGKGLLSAIVSALPKVEMWMHKPELEQICALVALGHISNNGAKVMINSLCDSWSINLNLSREINFKWGEMSSIWESRKWLKYCKNLCFSGSSFKAMESIKQNPQVTHLMTHALTAHSAPLFEALNHRLVFIRFVRCPASTYMITHVGRWISRWDSTDSGQTVLYKSAQQPNNKFPYHAMGIEDEYLLGNTVDRAVTLTNHWIESGDTMADTLTPKGCRIIEIPFERFVFDPLPYIQTIAFALETEIDRKTKREMLRQKVPRKSLTDAPFNKVYADLGWKAPTSVNTIDKDFEQAVSFVAEHGERSCSAERLSESVSSYKTRYGL